MNRPDQGSKHLPERSPRRAMVRWSGRVLAALVALFVLVAFAGLIYQEVWAWREGKKHPAPGKLVDFGGRKQHLNCTGTGSPTVVLESGLGGTWMDWALVQPEVAQFTRVCSYDRAGMGWSDPGALPRDSNRIVAELDGLLARGGERPPYVLVGHSVGGYHVRVFADRYRNEVGGIVLVDAAHEELQRLPPEIRREIEDFARLVRWLRYRTYLGVPRLQGMCGQALRGLEHLQDWQTFSQCRPSAMRTLEQELDAVEADAKEVAATASLDNLPLVVLSRDYSQADDDFPTEVSEKARAVGDELQDELTKLSARGRRVTARGSGHYVQLDRPQAVIRAIREVTEAARHP